MDAPAFTIPLWADLISVALGGIQGALFASRFRGQRRLDLLGVALIGVLVGMGEGLIRGLLLNVPLVAFHTNWYLITAVAAALTGMLLANLFQRLNRLIVGLDALVIGLFGAFGTSKALSMGMPLAPAAFVGVASAVGGSILRDIMMGLPVAVGSLYAFAATSGALVLATVSSLGAPMAAAAIAGVATTTGVRLLAVIFDLSLPEQRLLHQRKVAAETAAINLSAQKRTDPPTAPIS